MTDTPNQTDAGKTEDSAGKDKWPELERVERHLKELEQRNAAMREAMDYTRSGGCLWRFSAMLCFSGAVMSWWFTGRTAASLILAAIGIVLLVITKVRQEKSEHEGRNRS